MFEWVESLPEWQQLMVGMGYGLILLGALLIGIRLRVLWEDRHARRYDRAAARFVDGYKSAQGPLYGAPEPSPLDASPRCPCGELPVEHHPGWHQARPEGSKARRSEHSDAQRAGDEK